MRSTKRRIGVNVSLRLVMFGGAEDLRQLNLAPVLIPIVVRSLLVL